MKNWLKAIAISAFAIMVISGAAMAAAPSTMPYQGRLTDENGNAISGEVLNVTFTIYDDSTSGRTALWTDIDTLTCDNNGVFTQELGIEVPIPADIFNGEKRWLGIQVGADDEMEPLQLLSSVPYAFASAGDMGLAQTLHGTGGQFISFPSVGAINLDSVEINTPGPGYVLVNAQMTVDMLHANGTSTYIRSSLQEAPGVVPSNQFGYSYLWINSAAASGEYLQNINVFRVFQVADAGAHKYFYNAYSSKTSNSYISLQITALYIPNAYGDVDIASKSMTIPEGAKMHPDE